MAAIYEPRGAAREYSPLALNYVKGCDHGCAYCYVPKMMRRFNSNYVHSDVYMKEEEKLKKEILASVKKYANSTKQVLLSFTSDPYTHFNNETKFTRWVLEILLEYNIPVSILTKGGKKALQDLDVIKQFGDKIHVGASLTLDNDNDSLRWEKHAALPDERLSALRIFHENGVRTWASFEPVIYPEQSLNLMKKGIDFIDFYKIGKLNHYKKYEDKIDWSSFLENTVKIMREHDKDFYIKNDLAKFVTDNIFLYPYERDMNFLSVKITAPCDF